MPRSCGKQKIKNKQNKASNTKRQNIWENLTCVFKRAPSSPPQNQYAKEIFYPLIPPRFQAMDRGFIIGKQGMTGRR